MAIRKEDIDANGMIINGPWAGHTIDEVSEFLEQRANAAATTQTPPKPGEATPPKTPTPEEILEEKNNERLKPLADSLAATNARLEQEDEEAFSATVKDYDKEFLTTKKTIRQLIAEQKKNLHPNARIRRGVHRQLYMLIKQQDPKYASRLMDTEEEVVPPTEEEVVTPPPPPTEQTPPPAAPSKPKTPPAVAPPTPPARTPAAPPKKSKLQGNSKTEAAAKAFGIEHDDYLKRLEESGTTQDALDAMTTNRQASKTAAGRKTVYDRV